MATNDQNQVPPPNPEPIPTPTPLPPPGAAKFGGFLSKGVMMAILGLLTLVLIVGISWGWMALQAKNAKIAQINNLRRVFAEHNWPETVKQAEALFAKYPETEATDGDQLGLALQFLADEQYQLTLRMKPAERKQAMPELIRLFERARKYLSLNENSLFALCDCYMELQQYDQAKAVIAEAERRQDIGGARFYSPKMTIERLLKKP